MPELFDPQIPFELTVSREEVETTVTVYGELDISTAPALASELTRALQAPETVVVDLRPVSFIDSAGVRVLLQHAVAADPSWRLQVVPGTGIVDRVFSLLGAYEQMQLRIAHTTPNAEQGPADAPDPGERPNAPGPAR